MVRRLLTNPEGVAVVIGEAGTGKTFAIVAAAEGWAQAGIELRAAAPTWRAANVLRDEGLPATAVASLLIELDRAEHEGGEGLAPGSVLLIDEAGMVDSATLARLVSHAERAEAKLVLRRRSRAAGGDRGRRSVPRRRRSNRADPPRRGDPPRARA